MTSERKADYIQCEKKTRLLSYVSKQWWRAAQLVLSCVNDTHRFCRSGTTTSCVFFFFPRTTVLPPRRFCMIFFPSIRVRQKPTLAGSQEGINYTLADSQFWLQTQWVQHKQTLVSIHSGRWIKQYQSLSTPLISPLSRLLHFTLNFADSLYCAVRYQRRKNASDFLLSAIPAATRRQRSLNPLPR